MPPTSKPVSTDSDLRRRIDKSMREGRFQNALDLGKQLFKYEPTPEHRELLLRCYLGRAAQLRDQGATRDAATVLEVASKYVGDEPEVQVRFAEELARVGATPQALQMLQ